MRERVKIAKVSADNATDGLATLTEEILTCSEVVLRGPTKKSPPLQVADGHFDKDTVRAMLVVEVPHLLSSVRVEALDGCELSLEALAQVRTDG